MKTSIRFRVYSSSSAEKPLLERIVNSDSCIQLDYDSLFKSFRCLFGVHCVVLIEFL